MAERGGELPVRQHPFALCTKGYFEIISRMSGMHFPLSVPLMRPPKSEVPYDTISAKEKCREIAKVFHVVLLIGVRR